jgi:hypothetical protein
MINVQDLAGKAAAEAARLGLDDGSKSVTGGPVKHNTLKLLGRYLMLRVQLAWLRWLSKRQR